MHTLKKLMDSNLKHQLYSLFYASVLKFLYFVGLEKSLESQKDDSQKKVETLESQMSEVTATLAKIKEKEETEDLGNKLNKLNEDLDSKLGDAESKLSQLNDAFEQFQSLTNENQETSSQKLQEVEGQIKIFKQKSEGSVQDVMGDTENLKVIIF